MNKSISKNTFFNVGYRILNVIFPLVISMYVSRILGPDGTGRVAYAQNILSYFLVFASVGIPTYGVREIARVSSAEKEFNKTFSELFLINTLTTSVCIFVYILFILFIPKFYDERFLFLAVGVSLFLNFFNIDWFYAGIEEYVYITIRSTAVKTLALVSLFIFVKDRNDVIIYGLISSLGLTANYILNIINIQKKVKFTISGLVFKKHIKPISILLLTLLASDLYNQIDVTMMGNMCTKEAIGYYSYAIKLVRIVTSLTTAISATMLPRMSRLYGEKRTSELNAFSNKVLSAVLLFVMPCTIGVFLCSDGIVNLLFGSEFTDTAPLIRVFCPIIIIISISYLCGSVTLTAINREKYLLYATVVGATCNIILNSFLIRYYGGIGAAVASIFAETMVLLLHYLFVRKSVKFIFVTWENAKALLATVFMTIIVLIIRRFVQQPILNLILSVFGGCVCYILFSAFIMHHKIALLIIKKIKNKISKA